MSGPEALVKRKVRDALKKAGAYFVSAVASGMTTAGTPDILACHAGRFMGIECKATAKGKPTAWQERRLEEIRAAGGIALVIHAGNLEELWKALGI